MEANNIRNIRNIRNNAEARRYELTEDGIIAHADYVIDGDVITFTHTIVPRELGGRGVASRLILFALTDVRERGLRIVARCPFVAAYIEKHPEWQQLLV